MFFDAEKSRQEIPLSCGVWKGKSMIPITMMNPGDRVRIKKITGSDKVRQHLSELGCVVDGDITIISRMGGNVIIQVKDSRVALDRSMANRILV